MVVARGWGWLTVIRLPPRVRSPFHHKRLDLSSSALTHLLLRGVKQPHFEVLRREHEPGRAADLSLPSSMPQLLEILLTPGTLSLNCAQVVSKFVRTVVPKMWSLDHCVAAPGNWFKNVKSFPRSKTLIQPSKLVKLSR